jgi:hypothetical protein
MESLQPGQETESDSGYPSQSDISVTLDFYLATPEEEAGEALDKLSSLI